MELPLPGIRVNAGSAGVVETVSLEHFPETVQAMILISTWNARRREAGPRATSRTRPRFLCSPEAKMVCAATR